jgi:hypothetical protein
MIANNPTAAADAMAADVGQGMDQVTQALKQK